MSTIKRNVRCLYSVTIRMAQVCAILTSSGLCVLIYSPFVADVAGREPIGAAGPGEARGDAADADAGDEEPPEQAIHRGLLEPSANSQVSRVKQGQHFLSN